MSFNSEQSVIQKGFLAEWDSNATPVKFDNTKSLVKGNGVAQDETKLNEWCSVSIQQSTSMKADINAVNMVRYTGNIFVNVFVKAGTGTQHAYDLAMKAAEALQNRQFDSVNTRAALLVPVGATANASFYQISVRVPYYRDEFFAPKQ